MAPEWREWIKQLENFKFILMGVNLIRLINTHNIVIDLQLLMNGGSKMITINVPQQC